MNIVRNLIIAGLILIVVGCNNTSTSEFTTVKVKEVQQVGSYTYLLVKAKGPEYWLAVPSMDVKSGETFHYQGGMLMTDFYSKELDKTFDEVIFLLNSDGDKPVAFLKFREKCSASVNSNSLAIW